MTINGLVDAIIEFLRLKTETLVLSTESGNQKPAQIVAGYLPAKRETDVEDFPYVIVRPFTGVDTKSDIGMDGDVTVKILIGTYSEDSSVGYQDAVNLLERIRRELLSVRILANQYDLIDFSWQFPDEQPYPQWSIECSSKWAMLVPTEINPFTEGSYGESY